MRDLVRRYVDAGRDAVGGERVEDLARDLLDWSRRNAQRLTQVVRREVQRQLRLAGVATREEVSELRKRVRSLERQTGTAGASGRKKTQTRKTQTRKGQGRKAQTRKAQGGKAQGGKTQATKTQSGKSRARKPSAPKASGPASRTPPE